MVNEPLAPWVAFIDSNGLHLHLGCGDVHLRGFVNVDCRYQPSVDRLDNIGILKRYEPDSVAAIYCSHTLDHFGRWDYQRVLARWFELLAPGGILRISTPDFSAITKRYDETLNLRDLIGALYAAQDYETNFRKIIFDFEMLTSDLRRVGFERFSYFEPFADDCSRAWFSLNIEAVKPE